MLGATLRRLSSPSLYRKRDSVEVSPSRVFSVLDEVEIRSSFQSIEIDARAAGVEQREIIARQRVAGPPVLLSGHFDQCAGPRPGDEVVGERVNHPAAARSD